MNSFNDLSNISAKQRVDEYNQNPNLCRFCNQPILAPYDKKLRDTKVKKFCSRSCAAKFNNLGVVRNLCGPKSILEQCDDKEIIEAFNSSSNITEFSKKIGYKYKMNYDNYAISRRLQELGLDIKDLKVAIDIPNLTKDQLFDRYQQWQTARSAIAKMARQTFNDSDKPKQCAICGYDKHYEVAHIKAVSDFDGSTLISEINDINNLVALCPNHHWEYDNGILDFTSDTTNNQ